MGQGLTAKGEVLKQASENIEQLLKQNIEAFPKSFNQTRFHQNCITVLRDTKNIEKCTPLSIARCMVKGAFLDLDFFRRECYAIPYKIKDSNPEAYELNFQTDYKGEIKLCTKYGSRKVIDIDAKIVREGDTLETGIKENQPICIFTPKPFNDGKMIGAIAYVRYADGGFAYDAMSIKELEETRRNYSKIPDGPAWQKSLGEMYKKMVLRRLTKKVALDFDNAQQDEAYDEGAGVVLEAEALPAKVNEVIDPFKEDGGDQKAIVQRNPEDQAYFDSFKKAYPLEEDWQIDVRVKTFKEGAMKK